MPAQPAAQADAQGAESNRSYWLRCFADIIEGDEVSPWARLSRNRWAVMVVNYMMKGNNHED
jgi:hypothetical protein